MAAGVKVGIIGGSGFYRLAELEGGEEVEVVTPWGAPSSPPVTGKLDGVEVVVLARHGKTHCIPPGEVPYRANLWALRSLGVTHVVAATACGSLREEIPPGMFVVLDSFIDRTTRREQSFYSATGLPGVCHVPMHPAFCPVLARLAAAACRQLDYSVKEGGVAVTIEGPRFSSRAESMMYRTWGADVVNMTTVPEVVLAREAGLAYTALALPTDYDCWRDTVVDQAAVLATFAANSDRVQAVVRRLVGNIASQDWGEAVETNRRLAEQSLVPGSEVGSLASLVQQGSNE